MQLLRPLLAALALLHDAGAPDDATDGPSEARCATLFHSGQMVSAELCFEALVARHPDNADLWMNWAVVAKDRAREIVQSGPVAPPEASERAAHLASAIARYDRALEVGGRLFPTTDGRGYYLSGRAEALKAADQLEASADTYREIDRLRRGAAVPWPAGEAEAWAARLAEGRARHAKLERCWQQRTSPNFTAALAPFCEEPEELAFLRQLFQPSGEPSPGPLRFFQDWPISDFRTRGGAFYVSLFKLEHDMQQLARLLADGELPPSFWQVLANFTQAHAGLAALTAETRSTPIVFPAELYALVAPWFTTNIFMPPAPRLPSGALSPRLDAAKVEQEYLESRPSRVVVDDFLSAAALASLLRFAEDATVWHQANQGYLGAYWEEGLNCPLLVQVVEELRVALPVCRLLLDLYVAVTRGPRQPRW